MTSFDRSEHRLPHIEDLSTWFSSETAASRASPGFNFLEPR
jgi:hypothetical protein